MIEAGKDHSVSVGTTSSHRSLRIALLVVAAAAMTLLLSQCRMVSDAIVAPGGVGTLAQQPKPKDCMRDCQDAFKAAQDAEQALHKTNVNACNDDPVCLANEEARHEAAMAQISVDRKNCLDGCHHQGGGTGGR